MKIKALFEKLKDFWDDFYIRSLLLLACSLAADAGLIVYNAVCLLRFYHAVAWYSGQILFYALLFISRGLLLIPFFRYRAVRNDAVEKDADMFAAISTSCSLFLLGIETILLAQYVYRHEIPLRGTNMLILLNGSYIVFKFIVSFTGSIRYRGILQRKTTLFCCKKYLSRVEGIFLFFILFGKLIELYGWKGDSMLVNVCYWVGILSGIYAIFMGAVLVYKLSRAKKNTQGNSPQGD